MQTNKQPRISIVVPCYNGAKYICETLDCLQKQTIDDWECIIVNDGSTDNSLDILKEYAAKDSRYKYIDKENGGPAIARNTAIAASSGKYILPLDADDLIAPSYAEKAIDYLEGHPNCKLVYCKAQFLGDRNDSVQLPIYNYYELPYENSIFCSCIYRRVDFEKTSGYNPNMVFRNEDWDFLLYLLNEKDDVCCLSETLFYYRQHGISRNHNIDEALALANLQMVMNHPQLYGRDKERTSEWINPMLKYYKTELDKIMNSKTYKLGQFLVAPMRWLKRR